MNTLAALKTSRFPSKSSRSQNGLPSLWLFALFFLSNSTCCRWLGHHQSPYQKNQYCQSYLRRFLHHFYWIFLDWNITHKSQATIIIGGIATVFLDYFMCISWKIHTFDTFVDAFVKKTIIFTLLTEARSLRNALFINELFVISDESVK